MRIKPEPAIYKLENVVTGDFYVGATRNAQNRRRDHYSDLKLERHRNPKLQDDFLSLGKDCSLFEFVVLEYLEPGVSDHQIVQREQAWMNFLHPTYNSRNALPKYGHDLDLEKPRHLAGRRGEKQTQDEKDKRAAAVRAFWKVNPPKIISEYQRNAISEKMSGDKHPLWGKPVSDERKKKISDGVSKVEYTFIDPNGDTVVFRNMNKFRKEHHIGNKTLSYMMRGLIAEHKGWKFVSKKFVDTKTQKPLD